MHLNTYVWLGVFEFLHFLFHFHFKHLFHFSFHFLHFLVVLLSFLFHLCEWISAITKMQYETDDVFELQSWNKKNATLGAHWKLRASESAKMILGAQYNGALIPAEFLQSREYTLWRTHDSLKVSAISYRPNISDHNPRTHIICTYFSDTVKTSSLCINTNHRDYLLSNPKQPPAKRCKSSSTSNNKTVNHCPVEVAKVLGMLGKKY
mgnify:FL=1